MFSYFSFVFFLSLGPESQQPIQLAGLLLSLFHFLVGHINLIHVILCLHLLILWVISQFLPNANESGSTARKTQLRKEEFYEDSRKAKQLQMVFLEMPLLHINYQRLYVFSWK